MQLAFEQGFWIRGIGAYGRELKEAVDREVEILQLRENMSIDELDRHDPTFDVQKNIAYYFSPATFVKAGIPTNLFSDEKFGLIIQTGRKIPAWCSGLDGQVMTETGNDVDFGAEKLGFKYDKEHQIQNVTSPEIGLMFQRLANQYIRERSALELYDELMEPRGLPYNEGLFRYIGKEIQALVINNTPKSAFYALKFQEKSKLTQLPFYQYQSTGLLVKLSPDAVYQLAAQYDSTKKENNFAALFQFEALKAKPTNKVVPEQAIAKNDKIGTKAVQQLKRQ